MEGGNKAKRAGGRELTLPTVPAGAVEVEELRCAQSVVFRDPKRLGHLIHLFGGPLHWQGKAGWHEYDLRLKPSMGFDLAMEGADHVVKLNGKANADRLLRMERDKHWLELTPVGIDRRATSKTRTRLRTPQNVQGNNIDFGMEALTRQGRLEFPGAFGPGVDLTIWPLEQSVKKLVSLAEMPPLPPEAEAFELTWRFDTDALLTVNGKPWDGQEISTREPIVADTGWRWRPPLAVDARGEACVGELLLRKMGATCFVMAAISADWLRDPSRVWPVTIDPDTFYSETNDGYIYGQDAVYATARSTSANSTDGGIAMAVGQRLWAGEFWPFRSFIECDTSSILVYQVVQAVTLTLTCKSDSSNTDFDLTIRKCDWTPVLAANREANYDAALAASLDAIWRNTAGIALDTNYTSPSLDVTRVGQGVGGKWQAALVSQRDVDATAPGGFELVDLYTANEATAGYRPLLTATVCDLADYATATVEHDSTGTLSRHVINWSSDCNGDCILNLDGVSAPRLEGRLVRLVTQPASGAAPTDNYDITLEDMHGNDVLQGAGANRDTANTETAWISETASSEVPVRPVTRLCTRFVVANAGAGKSGLAVIYAAHRVVDSY